MSEKGTSTPVASLLESFDAEMRAQPPVDPGQVVEHLPGLVRTRGAYNMILFSRLDETDVERAVAEQAAFFAERAERFEWKLYAHDRSAPSLRAALEARAFEPDDAETLLVLDLSSAAPELRAANGVEVRAVRSPADLAVYAALIDRVFGRQTKSELPALAKRMLGDQADTIGFVAYLEGEPAAAGRLQLPVARSFASIWSGGTDPNLRRRGIYTSLVTERVRVARARGYRYLTVDALDTSRPILERLGFVALTTVRGWNFGRV